MVACFLGRMQAALEIGERPFKDRSPVFCPVKARTGFGLGMFMTAIGTGIVFRNRPLILREDVNAETLFRVQVCVRARRVIHADQHEQRIERHGGECVRGHAMNFAMNLAMNFPMPIGVEVHRNDGHAGGEASHRFAEFGWIQRHGARLCPPTLPCRAVVSFEAAVALTAITPVAPGKCGSLLASLRRGAPISRESAVQLIRCQDEDLPELLAAARAAKERFKPDVITYSRKVFIPLTNLCRDYCGYCAFRRDPGEAGAHTMTPDEVLAVARAGEKLGCTEALFSLGDKPELLFPEMRETLRHFGYKSTLHYLEAMCELVLRETTLLPHPNPGLLSAEWISRLAAVSPSMGLMLETTSAALLAPGAAHHNAPDKVPAKRLHTIEEAGKQRVPFTTGLLIGIGESSEERVDTLLAIRDLNDRYGHIQEVIVQNFRVKAAIPMAHWPEPTRGEMLRAVAVARLLLPEVNIQAPPNLSAPYYEELLDAGINDWGGISPLTPDYINPEKPWPHLEQLRLRTEAKGCELRQRLPVYPEFLSELTAKRGLLSEKLKAAAGDDGMARVKRAA
jgi:7,8-didemethyl-8-hydroxy-5-deazariboflavin synthase CofG subunit